MNARPRRLILGLALLVTPLLPACDGGGGGGTTPELTSLTIDISSSTVESGTTITLSVSGRDQDGEPISVGSVQWSTSAPSVATVSGSGSSAVVTGFRVGSAVITATASPPEGATVTRSVTVTVVPGEVEEITISPSSPIVEVGQVVELTARLEDAEGNEVTDETVDWSSSAPSVASFSGSGARSVDVLGNSPGSSTLTARVGGVSASTVVTVTAGAPAELEVTPPQVSVSAGASAGLTATVRDASGNELSDGTVSWTSGNSDVATVSASGSRGATVTGMQAGSTTATASIAGLSFQVEVTVTAGAVASVTVSPSSLTVGSGESGTLSTTLRDAQGNVLTGLAVTWSSSNAAVASVSSSGDGTATVTGGTVGSATITATAGGVEGQAQVTVEAGGAASVTLSTSEITFGALEASFQLTATVRDAGGNVIENPSVVWSSSDEAVATVSAGGVTATGNGTAQVSATVGQASASAAVTVAQVVTAIVLGAPSTAEANKVMSPAVLVRLLDANGNVATNSSASVGLSIPLSRNPTGGALAGTTTRNAVEGVATFDDVAITKRGSGFRIRATSGSFQSTSADIEVGLNRSTFGLDVTAWGISGQGRHSVLDIGDDVTIDNFFFQVWNSEGCPGCFSQVIVGYGDLAVTCGYNAIPGVHPGASTGAGGAMPRPGDVGAAVTGTFQVRARQTLEFNCVDGGGAYNSNPPTAEQAIGSVTITDNGRLTAGLTDVSLDGGGEERLAVVAPGAVVTFSADFVVWNQPGCPGCVTQIVVGIGDDARGCLYTGGPGVAPGVSASAGIQLNAPSAAGVYEVRYKTTQEFNCADAQGNYEAGPPPSYRTLGTIVVVEN